MLGRRYADLPNPGLEVGVLLDASAQHAGRTGRETLAHRGPHDGPATVAGRRDARRRQPDRDRGRPPGPQLLPRHAAAAPGIATALIGDPEVLILDEPANGLDPAGIRWMRDLLRGFANEGGTVLLSSHLLHEIEVIADDLVVIGNGRIVAQGTKDDLPTLPARSCGPAAVADLGRALSSSGIAVVPMGDDGLSGRRRSRPGRQGRPRRRRPPPRAADRRRRRARGDVPRAHRRHIPRRSSSMTTLTLERTERAPVARPAPARIPFTRVLWVELTKMFDTRSGFWLMMGIAISAVLATASVIVFAADNAQTYDNFGAAIGIPMVILLPIIAILSVTSEWSQRSGLTTFTLLPNRGRVIWAKLTVSVAVGALSMVLALAIGAVGNVVGSTIAGVDTVWDISMNQALSIVFANVLQLLIGFMLAVLIRNSAGAIVAYFVYNSCSPR